MASGPKYAETRNRPNFPRPMVSPEDMTIEQLRGSVNVSGMQE
jgi:hypothetical protein